MILQRKNLLLIIPGIFILLFLFLIFLFFGKIKEEKELLKKNLATVQEKEEELKILENLKLEYVGLKEEIEKTDQIIPLEQNQQGLMSRIEKLSVKNGLVLESIDFSSGSQEEIKISSLKVLGAKIKLIGSYSSFKNFISDVENNLRLIDVYNFKILNKITGAVFSKVGANSDEILSFELKLNSYYK